MAAPIAAKRKERPLQTREALLTLSRFRGERYPTVDIIAVVLSALASLLTLAEKAPKLINSVAWWWLELWQRLRRGWVAFKGDEPRLGSGVIRSFDLPPRDSSRQRNYFGPFREPVSKSPQGLPSGTFPPPFEKPEPNRDFMLRGPQATTDASRPFTEDKTFSLD